MIISPGRRYIFVHIPKTGGTSMAAALEARAHRDDILIGDTEKAQRRRGRVAKLRDTARGRLWKHSTLAEIDGIVSGAEMDAMLCFCLVRNPWDRAVSYYHWLRAQNFDHPAVRLARTLPFDAFLHHRHTRDTLRAWPYARYMTDARGQTRGLFVRLEHLAEDMEPVIRHLGFAPDVPHVNRSDRAPGWRAHYTEETRDIVATCCAADIARFGYRF